MLSIELNPPCREIFICSIAACESATNPRVPGSFKVFKKDHSSFLQISIPSISLQPESFRNTQSWTKRFQFPPSSIPYSINTFPFFSTSNVDDTSLMLFTLVQKGTGHLLLLLLLINTTWRISLSTNSANETITFLLGILHSRFEFRMCIHYSVRSYSHDLTARCTEYTYSMTRQFAACTRWEGTNLSE